MGSEQRYQCLFPQFHNDRAQLADFFRVTLRIPDCKLEYLLDEIRELKGSETVDFDRIKDLLQNNLRRLLVGSHDRSKVSADATTKDIRGILS